MFIVSSEKKMSCKESDTFNKIKPEDRDFYFLSVLDLKRLKF